jgi:hypothetical protein
LAKDSEKLSGAAWEFAGKDEGRLAFHREAFGDYPPDVVIDSAWGWCPARGAAGRLRELIDRDALEKIPDV